MAWSRHALTDRCRPPSKPTPPMVVGSRFGWRQCGRKRWHSRRHRQAPPPPRRCEGWHSPGSPACDHPVGDVRGAATAQADPSGTRLRGCPTCRHLARPGSTSCRGPGALCADGRPTGADGHPSLGRCRLAPIPMQCRRSLPVLARWTPPASGHVLMQSRIGSDGRSANGVWLDLATLCARMVRLGSAPEGPRRLCSRPVHPVALGDCP